MKGQTLTAVLFSVVLKRPHGARTENLHFSNANVFSLDLSNYSYPLELMTNKPFWLKHFGRYDPITATVSSRIQGFATHLTWELLFTATGANIYFCKLSLMELLTT